MVYRLNLNIWRGQCTHQGGEYSRGWPQSHHKGGEIACGQINNMVIVVDCICHGDYHDGGSEEASDYYYGCCWIVWCGGKVGFVFRGVKLVVENVV